MTASGDAFITTSTHTITGQRGDPDADIHVQCKAVNIESRGYVDSNTIQLGVQCKNNIFRVGITLNVFIGPRYLQLVILQETFITLLTMLYFRVPSPGSQYHWLHSRDRTIC